jgi:hypothetical protein
MMHSSCILQTDSSGILASLSLLGFVSIFRHRDFVVCVTFVVFITLLLNLAAALGIIVDLAGVETAYFNACLLEQFRSLKAIRYQLIFRRDNG